MQNTEMNIATVKPSEWKDFIKVCLSADLPTMTWGASGIGKSDGLRQIAEEEGYTDVIDIRLSVSPRPDARSASLPSLASY